MSEPFDVGPLTWVKEEIDQSLTEVIAQYSVLLGDLKKVDGLQKALSHLYQAQGALDMVGLEGCQRFCAEIQSATEKLKNNAITPSKSIVESLIAAVQSLMQYLNDLLQGMPDLPLRLFAPLQALVQAQGDDIDQSALFFPDTSFRPPADLPSKEVPSTAIPLFIGEQRIRYQKALIDWLLKGDSSALTIMQSALSSVQSVQDKPMQINLWWSASTLIDCLKQDAIAKDNGAKKLCRKLDQQLRDLAKGEHKRSQALLKEVLYYIGLSQSETEAIGLVKRTFGLEALMSAAEQHPLNVVDEAPWQTLLNIYQPEIASIKVHWQQLLSAQDFNGNIQTSDPASLKAVITTVQGLKTESEAYQDQLDGQPLWAAIFDLRTAVEQVFITVSESIALLTEPVLLEVASGLQLIEALLSAYERHESFSVESVQAQIKRLNAVFEDNAKDSNQHVAYSAEDDEVIRAVAQQIIESLVSVEKSVDQFFRAPTLANQLPDAIHQLKPVVAAFDMLEMPTPKTVAKIAVIYLEQFATNVMSGVAEHPNQSQFEVVAEALSLLGLFAHDLPLERTEVKHAMADCLALLEKGMDDLIADESEEVDYSADLDDRRVVDRRELGRLADIKEAREAEEITLEAIDDAEANATPQGVREKAEESVTFNLTPVVERAMDDELQSIYITEAEELLEHNRLNLAALRASPSHEVALTELRRAYHTLKGSGRTVGLEVLAEVAYSIEKLLNVLIAHKAEPSNEIIDYVSLCNQSFFDWVETLKEEGKVKLNAGEYQQQAAEMAALLEENLQEKQPKVKKEEVLIGGSRKVGRAFFYLFLGEAQQHLNTLIASHKALKAGSKSPPSASSRRAAHTLSSNALTAGFDAIGDLSRALENWFDEFYGPWSEKHLTLYGKVINALKDGLEKAKNLQHPKSTRALIIELSKTTAAMQVQASSLSNDTAEETDSFPASSLSDEERFGSGLSVDEITTNRVTEAGMLPKMVVEEVHDYDVEAVDNTETQPSAIAVEEVAADEAETIRYELKPPAFLPEDEMADVVAEFSLEPAQEEATEAEQMSEEPDIQLPPPMLLQPSKTEPIVESPLQPVLRTQTQTGDTTLVRLFVEEASELLPRIGKHLRAWKAGEQDHKVIEALQRDCHTLKGSARTTGQAEIGDQVHALEDQLERWLHQKPTLDDFDSLFVDYDRISILLEQLQTQLARMSDDEVKGSDLAMTEVEVDVAAEDEIVGYSLEQNESALTSPFLRVRASKLDQLISESGEVSILRSRLEGEIHDLKTSSGDLTLSISRLRTYLKELEVEADAQLQSRMSELESLNTSFDPLEMDRFTRLQELTRLMAESLHDISTIQNGLAQNIDQADVALLQQNRMNRSLQKGLMTVRMMPFSSISERLHRIVRQTEREHDKKVSLIIIGEEIELDRSVLDQMGAPLEHLLRNAVVHGIEMPADRLAVGKPETGTITLTVTLENDEIKLTIADDGRGLDLAQIQKVAVEKGLLSPQQTVNDETLISIVFESGFTTKTTVSQDSGRGVGLDAVKSDIAALNGRIDLNSELNKGVLFNVYLPVSMSVTQVVVVRVNDQQIAIPSVMIEQVQTLKSEALEKAYQAQSLSWNEQQYPLHFFARLLGDTDYVAKNQVYTPMVFLRSGQYRAVIHVDEVVGSEEVVMKPLGTQLSKVPGIIGATVMGDGAIVYVMNPVQLAHREVITTGASVKREAVPVEQIKKIALVVDDSLTMRKALSRILEKDGMAVVTANDGMDAMQKLSDIKPDVILTDIEMPRMDGFEFAKHLRESKKTKTLPLVMISSRTANKHHEYAKELGVDAFLGKPVQDDALLQAVHTLIPS